MANHIRVGTRGLHVHGIPPYLLDALKEYAQSRGLTLKDVVTNLITQLLDREKAGPKPKHTQDWTEIIDYYKNKA